MRGIGLIHLYILQLTDHLTVLCNHGGTNTETGTLLRNELEALTIQAGLGGKSPFNLNPTNKPWIEHCWGTNTLEAAHRYNIRIHGYSAELQKWMKNDSFLMDDFMKTYDPTKYGKFLQSINRVRLFLQLATTLDIQLACGWRCNPKILDLTVSKIPCSSRHVYE